jgi:hypothetical protein
LRCITYCVVGSSTTSILEHGDTRAISWVYGEKALASEA